MATTNSRNTLAGVIKETLLNVYDFVNSSKYDQTFTQSGIQYALGNKGTSGVAFSGIPEAMYPQTFSIGSQTPTGNVLVKKRAFCTLKDYYDPKYMDGAEKSLLRITKRLFQLKAFQIAAYESLTKFEQVLQNNHSINIPLLLKIIDNASSLGIFEDAQASSLQSTFLKIAQKELASEDTNFTTWYIDRFDLDFNGTGKGTGVIEFTNFNNFSCNNALTSKGSANVTFEDPYHIMMISNEDIELALMGAIYDAVQPNVTANTFLGMSLQKSSTTTNSFNDIVISAESSALQNTKYNAVIDQAILTKATDFDTPESIAYVRSKLRKLYLGKSVIQPTDAIYFFAQSNTVYEEDNDPTALSFNLDKYAIDDEMLKQEMMDVVQGGTMNLSMYKTLRNPEYFSGACLFTGVVETVEDSFAEGAYTLAVSCCNNLWYLEQSYYNSAPSLDQTQGILHDPLTPFRLEFDNFGNIKTINENGSVGLQLLQENLNLMKNYPIIHERGKNLGMRINEKNVYTANIPNSNIRELHHFPGMVYRWKEGIASFSANKIALADIYPGAASSAKLTSENYYGLNVLKQPFANMDAANAVSLVVTGQPYNISTFVDNTLKAASVAYFDSFSQVFQKQNKSLGSFKPLAFSQMSMDEYKKIALKRNSINAIDTKIEELQSERDKLSTDLNQIISTGGNVSEKNSGVSVKAYIGLKERIRQIDLEMQNLIKSYNTLDANIQNISSSQDSLGFSLDPEVRSKQMDDFINRQRFLSQRRIEDVRYNKDTNYLIVGPEYEADTDIQAFRQDLEQNKHNFWTNTFTTAWEVAKEAAGTINFELFCNNSGHIIFRPPQYNKVPLSVYYAMFKLNGQSGVNLIPDFVKNMFVDNVTGTKDNVIMSNWRILLELGKDQTGEIVSQLSALTSQFVGSIFEFFGYNNSSLRTKVAEGKTTKEGNSQLTDGDITNEVTPGNAIIYNKEMYSGIRVDPLTLDELNGIAVQYQSKFGLNINIDPKSFITKEDKEYSSKKKALISAVKSIINDRNIYLKNLKAQFKNLGTSYTDSASLTEVVDNENSTRQQKLYQEVLQRVLASGMHGASGTPQISSEFYTLIEDDTKNFLGRGSGRRFIIRDDSIIGYSVKEMAPEFCRVDVNGHYPNSGSLETVYDGAIKNAGAVDYDLWRMYGFKQMTGVAVPYLSNTETQLKPYAVFLLLRQRRKILSGSIKVVGNEYYQIGDVVYLPDRDLLFYVTGVSHSFTNGESFLTTLSIEYGRAPGEYLPSPLDVIGKTMLRQATAHPSFINRELHTDTNYYPLCSVDARQVKNGGNVASLLQTGDNQAKLINALLVASTELAERPNARLVVTVFKTISSSSEMEIKTRGMSVINWLKNPVKAETLPGTGSENKISLESLVGTTSSLSSNQLVQDPYLLDLTKPSNSGFKVDDNELVSTDQMGLVSNNKNDPERGMIYSLNPSQYSHEAAGNVDNLEKVVEIGLKFLSDSDKQQIAKDEKSHISTP